jgi:5,10-methylene-tetrahydrofolate dehydrogenase/methenyl tetrahydrofolate cyclohydrolase
MKAASPSRPSSYDHALLIAGDADETERLVDGLKSYPLGDLALAHDERFRCCRAETVPQIVERIRTSLKEGYR